MYETLVEMGAEFSSVVVRAVGAVCAASAGAIVEMNGIQTLGAGEPVIGLWMTLLGCLLLVVSYVFASETLQLLRQPTD